MRRVWAQRRGAPHIPVRALMRVAQLARLPGFIRGRGSMPAQGQRRVRASVEAQRTHALAPAETSPAGRARALVAASAGPEAERAPRPAQARNRARESAEE